MGQVVLTDTLLSVSHAAHVTAVMGMHPTYLKCFLQTQNALLQPDGPLPLSWRHYIIIMVRETATSDVLLIVCLSWEMLSCMIITSFLGFCRRLLDISVPTWYSCIARLFYWLAVRSPGSEVFTVLPLKSNASRHSTNF